jgi:hypothetical protein
MLLMIIINNNQNSSSRFFLLTTFSATIYSRSSKREPKAAITNEGRSIRKVTKGEKIGNSKYLKKHSGYLLNKTAAAFLFIK